MKYAIAISNLSKAFRIHKRPVHALRNVSLTVRKGEIFALLGPNGSGKTTLINIIVGLISQDKGKVKILNRNPREDRTVLQKVNYVPTGSRAQWRQTPLDVLTTYARMYGVKNYNDRIRTLVERLGISHFKKRRWYTLSTGEQARVRLAKGFINDPEILILDEPTLGLDPKSADSILKELKRMNKRTGLTIFLTSHNMRDVTKLSHRAGFIKDGRLMHVGSAKAIKKRYGGFERYWLRLGNE